VAVAGKKEKKKKSRAVGKISLPVRNKRVIKRKIGERRSLKFYKGGEKEAKSGLGGSVAWSF